MRNPCACLMKSKYIRDYILCVFENCYSYAYDYKHKCI